MNIDRFSIQILLPDDVDRSLRRWTEETPGASWPSWGGHVTLLPRFRALISAEELGERVVAACARFSPMDLRLTEIVEMKDWTRSGYSGVFLVPSAEPGSGMKRLKALQAELDGALAPVREDLAPEVTRHDFLPHVTLALAVSEAEATKMVSRARAQSLSAEFTLDRVWLLQFIAAADGETSIEQTVFLLSSPVPDA